MKVDNSVGRIHIDYQEETKTKPARAWSKGEITFQLVVEDDSLPLWGKEENW